MGSGTCSTVPCWTAGWCQRKGQSAHRQQIVCCWSPLKLLQWRVVAERSSALDSSSGVVRMWVRIPAWPVAALASLSKTLVLRMGRKAVGPVCCVMHVKEPRTLCLSKIYQKMYPVSFPCGLLHDIYRKISRDVWYYDQLKYSSFM